MFTPDLHSLSLNTSSLKKIMDMKLYQDPKALLNRVLRDVMSEKMSKSVVINPTYRVIASETDTTEPKFEVGVFYKGKMLAKHKASKAKTAGKFAAVRALMSFKKKSKYLNSLESKKNSSIILQQIYK